MDPLGRRARSLATLLAMLAVLSARHLAAAFGTAAQPCANPAGACAGGQMMCFDADNLGAAAATGLSTPASTWLGTLPSCAAAITAAAGLAAPGQDPCDYCTPVSELCLPSTSGLRPPRLAGCDG